MKDIGIKETCTENWNNMSPTDKGAFCDKCTTEVYDLTNKSNRQIQSILLSNKGHQTCVRITPQQEDSLINEFNAWRLNSKVNMQRAFLFTMITVFGLTLFSCSSNKEESIIEEVQNTAFEAMNAGRMVNGNLFLKQPEQINELNVIGVVEEVLDESLLMDYTMIEEQEIDFEEVEVRSHDVLMGAMISSHSYVSYLEELHPTQDIQIEYDENGREIPTEFAAKVFPNPVNSIATLELALPEDKVLEINLYNTNGQHLRTLNRNQLSRGTRLLELNLIDEQPGTYFITIYSDEYKKTVKAVKT